jgi:hypothetical protein
MRSASNPNGIEPFARLASPARTVRQPRVETRGARPKGPCFYLGSTIQFPSPAPLISLGFLTVSKYQEVSGLAKKLRLTDGVY